MFIDLSTPPTQLTDDRLAAWANPLRVFISSAMADTRAHRLAVAEAVDGLGATPVWFEEFGGRDGDAEQAYLSEVDSSTVYLGILAERYGRRLPNGYSATEAEYHRAIEEGKRISIWVAEHAADRDGNLTRFVEDLRTFHVTGLFTSPDDLAQRVDRRLREMAAQDNSPWVKLNEFVFRAGEIIHDGNGLAIKCSVDPQVLNGIENLRSRVRVTSELGVVEGEIGAIDKRLEAGRGVEATIRLVRVGPPPSNSMRAGTAGFSADDLVEFGIRNLLIGDPLPSSVAGLAFLADPGLDSDALVETFMLNEAVAQPVTRLFLTDGLVGSGKASAVINFTMGPRFGNQRRVRLEWEEPRTYSNVPPKRRVVEGDWQLGSR